MTSDKESYTADYQWTRAHFLEAMRHHYRSRVRPSFVMTLNLTAVLLSALSVLILSTDRSRLAANASALMFLGLTFFWFFVWRRATDWWLGRGFDKRLGANLPVEWEFSRQSVNLRWGDLASSTLDWKIFKKLVETKEGFLLYVYPGRLFHWLPFSAFGSSEGSEKLKQFVRDHQIPAVRVGW